MGKHMSGQKNLPTKEREISGQLEHGLTSVSPIEAN